MGKSHFALALSGLALLAACGTGPKRQPIVHPPAPPPPPTILPLGRSKPLIRLTYTFGPDAIDLLIKEAEGFYAAGMDDYRAGNFEKSRQEFDRAVNVLLRSKFDIRADERLSAEFDQLAEKIYTAEGAALERGDALSVQKYEPTPIESFEGLTFPVDPRVRERVEQEVKLVRSDLPLISNDAVAGVINYLQTTKSGQVFIRKALSRSGLYEPVISETLRKEGLPRDLIYLAAPESAYNPLALSRAGAKGIWQLMPARAAQYGLKRDRWVDEREDPLKSTQAALRHLKDLYQMFGDWYLAMAAYDWGPVNVQKAVEKTGYADYWTLRKLHAFPKETENYVPIILATAYVAKDPKAFGFDVQPDPPLAYDQVSVLVPTDLRLVAQLIDRPVEELIRLNPSLLRWTTPANDPQFALNLPAGTKSTYEQAVGLIPPAKRIWWRAHRVAGGETLSSIARKWRVSPTSLALANGIERNAPLEQGSHLVVPLASGKATSLIRVRERGPRVLRYYRVRPGDGLELIGDRFDVTPYQIRRWNNLKTSRLIAGRTLRLYLPAERRIHSRRVQVSRLNKSARKQ